MNAMPSCFVRGVRSVELVASNLEEAARFYETVWGLTAVEGRPTFSREEVGDEVAAFHVTQRGFQRRTALAGG